MKAWNACKLGLRGYRVLAIESSCDDCCAAVINRSRTGPPVLESHVKRTLNSSNAGGVIPTDALVHHLENIPGTVQEALKLACSNGQNNISDIELVCATQGPGFFSSLAAGMQIGKGVALALNVPFVPVHHMLGHLLTPRFQAGKPKFPFNSLLVSGGHTIFVHSKSLYQHEILINSLDISVGNSLDKCARHLGIKGTMLGKLMHELIGNRTVSLSDCTEILDSRRLIYENHFTMALDGYKKRTLAFSFAHYATQMLKLQEKLNIDDLSILPEIDKKLIASKIEDSMFNHLIQKLALVFTAYPDMKNLPLVVSGGVSSNQRLRELLHQSFETTEILFPDVKWCTDNALMIGWAGIEMYEHSLESKEDTFKDSMSSIPIPKWPLPELQNTKYVP